MDKNKMEISLARTSDLTNGMVESLLQIIDTPEKRRTFLGDLCTLREYLEKLFIFHDSPLKEEKSHPAFRIMVSVNEVIGGLLNSDEILTYLPNGMIVEVKGTKRFTDNTPKARLKSMREYKEYVMEMGLTFG